MLTSGIVVVLFFVLHRVFRSWNPKIEVRHGAKFLRECWLAFIAVASLKGDQKKLTMDQRVELLRGLNTEYATVKVPLPRSKKPLEFNPTAPTTKQQWSTAAQADRPGGAHRGSGAGHARHHRKRRDHSRDQQRNASIRAPGRITSPIGMGGAMKPVSGGQNANAPGGTTIALRFTRTHRRADVGRRQKDAGAGARASISRPSTEQYVETIPARSEAGDREQEGHGRNGSRPGVAGAGPSRAQDARNQGRRSNTKTGSTAIPPAA